MQAAPGVVASKKELRCFCRGEPLLAMYGVNSDGQLYVHVRIYKQGRVFGETYQTGGVVKIKCRNCFRWNKVTFVENGASPEIKLEESSSPLDAGENPPAE